MPQRFDIELDRETDGRWIAEIPALPGVMVYGDTRAEAVTKVEALALRVIADRIEHGELPSGDTMSLAFAAPSVS
ncbi:MAG: type II toxin-antitoxin system HicB family antitoxin [Deltaproteobacteria bacterium]